MAAPKIANPEILYAEAEAAGIAAGEAAAPRPMIVYEADVLTGRAKPDGQAWHVPEGVCGFAWVNIRPGTSSFARWLKAAGHARRDSYYGGVTIWIGAHGQSYERKMAHARAMAAVFAAAGIEARASGRLD